MSRRRRKRPDHSRHGRPPQRRPPRDPHASPPAPRVLESVPAPDGVEDQDLMQSLRRALRSDDPLDLLMTVSGIIEALDPDRRHPFEQEDAPRVTLAEIVDSFMEVDFAQTTAALMVIEQLVDDDLLVARVGRALSRRTQPMPPWLTRLGDTRLDGTAQLTDPLGDGADYLVGVRLGDGTPLTALVYVDANLGHAVKDAFVVPAPWQEVTGRLTELAATDGGHVPEPVDPGLARAVVTEAIARSAMFYPPVETDTWPLCRPLVRWMLRLLPDRTAYPAEHEWTAAEQDELRDRFLGSRWGAAYADDEDARYLVESIIWLGTYDDGDPTRWSHVRVEILMLDRFPRKVVAPVAELAALPQVLGDFVRFCHAERGVAPEHTDGTLQAIAHHEPEFQQLIRSARPDSATTLARMLLGDHQADAGDWLDDLVGGRGNLQDLTGDPLPDEPFEWAGVPEDLHPKVREILALCDSVADVLLDVEHRTAQRRLLSRLVVGDPAYFRGRAAARTHAAAVCWMVAKANDTIGQHRDLTGAELLAPLGGGSPSQRVTRFLEILGVPPAPPGEFTMAAPDLLVGSFRRELVEQRDLLLG